MTTKTLTNAPVTLHVYDLSESNSTYYAMGFGLYHSGLEVHGTEYSWGTDGPFCNEPKKAYGVMYRESLVLGHTNKSSSEVAKIAATVAQEMQKAGSYHILQRNCNHYARAMAEKLVPNCAFPGWVNRAAGLGGAFSWMLPQDAFGDRQVPNGSSSTSVPAAVSYEQQQQKATFNAFSGEGRTLGHTDASSSSSSSFGSSGSSGSGEANASGGFFSKLWSRTSSTTSTTTTTNSSAHTTATTAVKAATTTTATTTSVTPSTTSGGTAAPTAPTVPTAADRQKILMATQQRLKSSSANL